MLKVQKNYLFSEIDFIYRLNRIYKLCKSVRFVLVFLVTPEDSSNSSYGKMILSTGFNSYAISGVIKIMFWIFISVIVGILIGQLN